MAEVKLTLAQQAVVENRGGALLVSAAAGSGKTKVLIDRLLSYVEDPDDPANIDDFLMITYTKAAAPAPAHEKPSGADLDGARLLRVDASKILRAARSAAGFPGRRADGVKRHPAGGLSEHARGLL